MNGNLSWSQFGPYVPQHGATDLEDHAAMDVAGGGIRTNPRDRAIPPSKNTMSARLAVTNAKILGQMSPN